MTEAPVLSAGELVLHAVDDGVGLRFSADLHGVPVGRVWLTRLPDQVGQIACHTEPAQRRQGHGFHAVSAVLRWALSDGGFERVQARLEPDDHCARSLAMACGLRREGLLRSSVVDPHPGAPRRDVLLYAVVRADLADDPAQLRWGAVRAELPTKGVAAGVLARNRRGEALVVETSYKAHWEVPGGLVEQGEGVVTATRRELAEDLGVALPVGDLLVLDCSSTVPGLPSLVCLLFDGGVHDDDLVESFTYPDGEIIGAHWADDALLERCGPRLSRRMRAGLAALADGRLPGPPLMLRGGVVEQT